MSGPAGLLPNLYILGAQKAGTTWLFDHLQAHPEVFGSRPKELFFWNKPPGVVAKRLATYRAAFAEAEAARWRLEASATYLWIRSAQSQYDLAGFQRDNNWRTIENLAKHGDPDSRFVVMLRQPTARAVSAFFHHWRRDRIGGDARLLMEGRRWGVLDMGFYDRQIPLWLEAFDRDRFHFVLFDDLRRDPAGALRGATAFLGLSGAPGGAPERPRNAGGGLLVEGDALTVATGTKAPAPTVWREETAFLNRAYAPTIDFCEALLDRPLPDWRAEGLEALLRL